MSQLNHMLAELLLSHRSNHTEPEQVLKSIQEVKIEWFLMHTLAEEIGPVLKHTQEQVPGPALQHMLELIAEQIPLNIQKLFAQVLQNSKVERTGPILDSKPVPIVGEALKHS
jgi:hypothetical protein